MRPLFPKDYRNDVTLNNMVMSVDPDVQSGADCNAWFCDCNLLFLISRLTDRTATTQVGLIDGEFIINPTSAQWKSF